MLFLVLIAAVVIGLLPTETPAASLAFFAVWTLLVFVQIWLAAWASADDLWCESTREPALNVSLQLARGTVFIWGLFLLFLLFAHVSGVDPDQVVERAVRLLVTPVMLWLPISMMGHSISLLLYVELRDWRVMLFRLASVAAIMLVTCWVVFESA